MFGSGTAEGLAVAALAAMLDALNDEVGWSGLLSVCVELSSVLELEATMSEDWVRIPVNCDAMDGVIDG